MNKGHNNSLLCPLFIYGYQFQTTINPCLMYRQLWERETYTLLIEYRVDGLVHIEIKLPNSPHSSPRHG